MIDREEIKAKSLEYGIHFANVQRDYVFGWLLAALFSETNLKDILILKGGNGFRKAYFPNSRFSNDLDFSTEIAVDEAVVLGGFNAACQIVQDRAGVRFEIDRNQIRLQNQLDDRRRVFDLRVYFKDFFGNAEHITIRLSIDITEFDKIYLPTQMRSIIHPYSDHEACSAPVRCLKLEEMIANKLKCLLQRRHVPDVYDLIYSVFINRDIAVDRGEVLATFLRKTIYARSPGAARGLFLDLPLAILRTAWSRYILAPTEGVVDFDVALGHFRTIVESLFEGYADTDRGALAFFPSALRTPLMAAGADRRLVRLSYEGVVREIEPYSLAYKRRKDGHGEEYLYAYDRTGGRSSGPGLKSMLNTKIERLELLEEKFEPRYPIELGKAGEEGGRTYFGASFGSRRSTGERSRIGALRHGWQYTVECSYCSRRFKRMRRDAALKRHKDGYGNDCFGRRGMIVDQRFI